MRIACQMVDMRDGTRSATMVGFRREVAQHLLSWVSSHPQYADSVYVLVLAESYDDTKEVPTLLSRAPLLAVRKFIELFAGEETSRVFQGAVS